MLENAPEDYSMVLTCEQCVKVYILKIEDLQEAMIQMYRTIYGNKLNTDTDTDIGLYGVMQGDPLSPTIFNVVVDGLFRHWVAVMVEGAEERGERG